MFHMHAGFDAVGFTFIIGRSIFCWMERLIFLWSVYQTVDWPYRHLHLGCGRFFFTHSYLNCKTVWQIVHHWCSFNSWTVNSSNFASICYRNDSDSKQAYRLPYHLAFRTGDLWRTLQSASIRMWNSFFSFSRNIWMP